MKKYLYTTIVFTLVLCLQLDGYTQGKYSKNIPDSERFSAGILFGFNNAQIDGDAQKGFDKFGITGGLRGIARINSRLDFNIEMLYSKKGSKIFSAGGQAQAIPVKDRIIDLTYIDAPISFKWLLKNKVNTWHIELGGIYSRLIDTEITEDIKDASREFVYQDAVADFEKDDIAILTGFGYTLQNGISFNLRYAVSVNKFYQNSDFEEDTSGSLATQNVASLRNYYYNLSISYTIFKRAIKGKK